jgi:hypothetical protein
MKTVKFAVLGAGLLVLGACNDSARDEQAEVVEENSEAIAEYIIENGEAQAENIIEAAENEAALVENLGEESAEAVRNGAGAETTNAN